MFILGVVVGLILAVVAFLAWLARATRTILNR